MWRHIFSFRICIANLFLWGAKHSDILYRDVPTWARICFGTYFAVAGDVGGLVAIFPPLLLTIIVRTGSSNIVVIIFSCVTLSSSSFVHVCISRASELGRPRVEHAAREFRVCDNPPAQTGSPDDLANSMLTDVINRRNLKIELFSSMK
jgi:hypothetical protein